jgi:NADPH:quinone reductase-like Zn-dependent oxidoreductase
VTAVVEPPVARLAALPGVCTASRVAAQADQARATGRVLPVAPALAGLLPDAGLRRGTTVAVHGASSLLLALLADATAAGSWAAVVGMPSLGLAAAAEYGVDVARMALIPRPGAELPAVVAALLDGVDLVVVHSDTVRPAVARRLSARARHRGAVLLTFGPWPGADVELSCRPESWTGPEDGYGHLGKRRALVRARGRGAAARPVSADLWLPGPTGTATPATPHLSEAQPPQEETA